MLSHIERDGKDTMKLVCECGYKTGVYTALAVANNWVISAWCRPDVGCILCSQPFFSPNSPGRDMHFIMGTESILLIDLLSDLLGKPL